MSLVVDGKATPLVLGEDAILGSRSAQAGKVDAPLVFIGYGLHLPEAKYDDFNSAEVPWAELKGKIVVYINGGPADLPGALKSLCADGSVCEGAARGRGGWDDFDSDAEVDGLWLAARGSGASQPGMRLAVTPDADAVAAKHPALADEHGAMFSATFNPAQAEKLFAGTGHTFAEMLALADAQKPLPRFALGKSVTGDGGGGDVACGVAEYCGGAEGIGPEAGRGVCAGVGASRSSGCRRADQWKDDL